MLQSTSLFIYATDRAKKILDIQNVKTFFEQTNEEILIEYVQENIENINKVIDYTANLDVEKISEILYITKDKKIAVIVNVDNSVFILRTKSSFNSRLVILRRLELLFFSLRGRRVDQFH